MTNLTGCGHHDVIADRNHLLAVRHNDNGGTATSPRGERA